jgi:hypothetical protein
MQFTLFSCYCLSFRSRYSTQLFVNILIVCSSLGARSKASHTNTHTHTHTHETGKIIVLYIFIFRFLNFSELEQTDSYPPNLMSRMTVNMKIIAMWSKLRKLLSYLFIVYLATLLVSQTISRRMRGCGRKWSWPNSRYYPGICLEGLRQITKNLGQDSRPSGRDLNPGPPEYEAGMLTTRPWRSVKTAIMINVREGGCPQTSSRQECS